MGQVVGLPEGCTDFRVKSGRYQRLVVLEFFLLVEKNAIHGQQHADGCHAEDVGSKQPENVMADLGFERFQADHVSLAESIDRKGLISQKGLAICPGHHVAGL